MAVPYLPLFGSNRTILPLLPALPASLATPPAKRHPALCPPVHAAPTDFSPGGWIRVCLLTVPCLEKYKEKYNGRALLSVSAFVQVMEVPSEEVLHFR